MEKIAQILADSRNRVLLNNDILNMNMPKTTQEEYAKIHWFAWWSYWLMPWFLFYLFWELQPLYFRGKEPRNEKNKIIKIIPLKMNTGLSKSIRACKQVRLVILMLMTSFHWFGNFPPRCHPLCLWRRELLLGIWGGKFPSSCILSWGLRRRIADENNRLPLTFEPSEQWFWRWSSAFSILRLPESNMGLHFWRTSHQQKWILGSWNAGAWTRLIISCFWGRLCCIWASKSFATQLKNYISDLALELHILPSIIW